MKRTNILTGSLFTRAALMIAVALLLANGSLGLSTLACFAFVYGALDAFFWPARDALLPLVVRPEQLARANSIMLTTNQIGLVLGPVLGGALIAAMLSRERRSRH